MAVVRHGEHLRESNHSDNAVGALVQGVWGMGYGYEHVKEIKESRVTGNFGQLKSQEEWEMVGRAHSTEMRYHTEPNAQKQESKKARKQNAQRDQAKCQGVHTNTKVHR